MTSTSILHSHVYKSVLGTIINSLMSNVPSGIHTGHSLVNYVPWYTKSLFVLIPILAIIMMKSLQNRPFITRMF